MTKEHTDKSVDLSVIVTAHSEGLIAHKTMLSIFAAVKELHEETTYEIIVSIDNSTDETKTYFESYKDNDIVTILNVSFKDLSQSRNNAVEQANGQYVTFIDADDLMSADWLAGALHTQRTHPGSIVHPEYSITFGDDNLIWKKRDSKDLTKDILCLIDNNLWDSPCLAPRSIFLTHPYIPNGNGFGYEDKHFNSETLSATIPHRVAPQSIFFVRRKVSGSMLRQSVQDGVTLAPTALLSYEKIHSLDISTYAPAETTPTTSSALRTGMHLSKKVLAKIHSRAKSNETYLKLIYPLRQARQDGVRKRLAETYPKWMTDSWKAVHKIDNTTFPAHDLLKTLPWYNAENTVPGYTYATLVKKFSKKPDTLFFVPHLIKGGADMVFINYINELARTHTDWSPAVLQTEAKQSVWASKITKDVDFIDLFHLFEGLDTETQYRLLATFITQNGIQRIIIGNSQLAYDFVSKYQTLIKRLDIAIYCFAFGEEFDDEGRLWGHIHTGIPRIYPVIYRIITDNENTVNKLEHEYSFDRSRFSVHYQPTAAVLKAPVEHTAPQLRILWASRVCKQKRPDLLRAISNKLDKKDFTIHAYGQLEEDFTSHYFDGSNVIYQRPFNGITDLPTNEYDIYLYTSEGDGVPNVLQEMTANGLPIVASNVGGIREFVMNDKTGFLIEDHENIDDYVAAIQQLRDQTLRTSFVQKAQDLLKTRFSADTWRASIARDIDK